MTPKETTAEGFLPDQVGVGMTAEGSDAVNTMNNMHLWAKGILAAAIAGAANGVITGFAAVGIDPQHFNLRAGLRDTLAIAAVSAAMSAIIGVAAYLKQSPLPPGD